MTESSQKTVAVHKNNMDAYDKLCHKLGDSTFVDPSSKVEISQLINALQKIGYFQSFRGQHMHTFSAVKQPKPLERKLRRRKKAVYRRIKKYYKSINQYKKERLRRKLCWLLTARFTQSEIAEMLGISRRTVIRDLDKIEPYYRRLNTNFWRKVNAEQKEEIEKKLKGKSPIAQFRILTNAMIEQFERFKGREYKRHYQIILLDLSQTDEYGIPKLQFIPRGHQTLAFPYEIAVHVKGVYEGNRFTAKLGGFTLTQTSGWR